MKVTWSDLQWRLSDLPMTSNSMSTPSSPAGFTAVQRNVPVSLMVVFTILNCNPPVKSSIRESGTKGEPPLYHVMFGGGRPNAGQFRTVVRPLMTPVYFSKDSLSITGGTTKQNKIITSCYSWSQSLSELNFTTL